MEQGLEIGEHSPLGGLFPASSQQQSLLDVIEALDLATAHPNVIGMVIKVDGLKALGFAQLQEIRDALSRFRAAGKVIVAYAEMFTQTALYYFAAVCNHVFLAQSGLLGVTGLMVGAQFFKHTLDKLKIEPQISQRKAYKSAANTFMQVGTFPFCWCSLFLFFARLWGAFLFIGFITHCYSFVVPAGPYDGRAP
jgi:protease-4